MTKLPHVIAILGAGSWGTALALAGARQGNIVKLWSISADEINQLKTERVNQQFLPGFQLPENIIPTHDLSQAIRHTQDIVIAVPSIGFRTTLEALKSHLTAGMQFICASKGLDEESGQLFSEIVQEIFPSVPYAVLSGPSFAREVAADLPTAVVLASRDTSFIESFRMQFASKSFCITLTNDITGVEIGGIVKNVMAIATGISGGLNLGTNARSALLNAGFNEMIRLGQALGGQLKTFLGLSGFGDLILTSLDDQSRNRRFGLAIGRGMAPDEAEQQIGQVVEGKRNASLVLKLAARNQTSMPVCELVQNILLNRIKAPDAYAKFFAKDLTGALTV